MRAIGAPFTADETAAFVARARSFVGVRWRHQGRDRRGLDCGGLLVACMREIGRDVYDPTGYGRLPYRNSLENTVRENMGDPVDASTLRYGDIAVFEWGNAAPNHVGIIGDYVYGGLSLIHAFAPNGQVIETRLDDDMRAKLVEVFRP